MAEPKIQIHTQAIIYIRCLGGGDWKRKLLTFSWSISALFDLFKQIRILIKENEIEMFNKKILHGKVEKRLHGKLP